MISSYLSTDSVLPSTANAMGSVIVGG